MPLTFLGQTVDCEAQHAQLLAAEMLDAYAGLALEPELFPRRKSRLAVDQFAVGSDYERIAEAKPRDRGGDFAHV